MRFSHCQAEAIFPRGGENQVNMTGHETVCPHLDPGLARLLGQQISINVLVAILKKGWPPGDFHAALRDAEGEAPLFAPIVPWGETTAE